jgi:putative transcriptional regulator
MKPEEIQEIRQKLGVTQEKLAQLLGTTVVTVNRWENGKVRPSRLYIKELKELRNNYGSYLCRRQEPQNS